MKILRAVCGLAVCLYSMSAAAYEFHGYLRSGMGASQGGSDQVCFQAPGSLAKFRLGNECETYGELSFGQDYGKEEAKGGAYFKSNVLLALSTAGDRDWEATNDDVFKLAFREAYGQAFNVFGEGGPSLWVGKRYYKRRDIHMLDFYYLNDSGPGAGVEDMALGSAKLHLAVTRNIPDAFAVQSGATTTVISDGPAQTNTDLRLSDIPAGGDAKLEAVVIYGAMSGNGSKTGDEKWERLDGVNASLIHTVPKFLDGNNTFVLQYGEGLFGAQDKQTAIDDFGGFSKPITKGSDKAKRNREHSYTTRAIEDWVMDYTDHCSGAVVLLYQSTHYNSENSHQTMIGYRPMIYFTKNAGLALEYGYTEVDRNNLQKITLAPQVSPSANYFGRPALRYFVTYARWSDGFKGQIGDRVYADDQNGWSTGAQLETWW